MKVLTPNFRTRHPIVVEMKPVRPLKIYIKTTLLASIITVLMMVVGLAFVSERIANTLREKERDLARLQAVEFAEHIANLPNPQDANVLQQSSDLVLNTQPGLVAVRVWKTSADGSFAQLISSADSPTPLDLPSTVVTDLQQKRRTEILTTDSADKNVFRAFAPLVEKNGRVFGAVEITQYLDSSWTIAAGYAQSEAGVAIAAVLLMLAATYLLFRYLIYRPLRLLLDAMAQAETGNLDVEAKVFSMDELGQVAHKFNRMVSSLNSMTKEREAYQDILQERISEATGELKQKNEQLTDASRELWRVSRRLTEVERLAAAGQTAAQFAHEVGTPLNLISGHIQLLRLKTKDEEASRLDVISGQIERIERIVRSMLDRTKISQGQHQLINLNQVLQKTFDATAPMFAENNIELNAELDENLPEISGDADHLQQIFINLINNSLDAIRAAGKLTVVTRKENEKVTIDFIDDGAGMTEEVRARIFDVLYTTKGKRGTGLGLVVVKQIVQEHGGEIEVESEAGKGTHFVLRFPAAKKSAEKVKVKTK